MSTHLIGDPATVVRGLTQLQERTSADEIMISTRVHSLESESNGLVAAAWGLSEPPRPHGND